MPLFTTDPNVVFRDYITAGVPSSGKFSPVKSDIRTLLNEMQDIAVGAAVTPQFVTPSWSGGDATTLLQSWLAYGVTNHVPLTLSGSYSVSGTLTITGPVTIAGGGGATITTSFNGDLFTANTIDGISISGLTLVGNRGSGPDGFWSAIAMYNCDDLSILNNTIRSFKGAGVFLTSGCLRSIVAHNHVSLAQFGLSVFKGCKRAVVSDNTLQDIDTDAIFIDDATSGDTAGTASANEDIICDSNNINNVAITGTGYGIAVSGSKSVIVSNNNINGGGVSGSVVATGIAVNSGQDDFNIARDVIVTGNTIRGMMGGGAIVVAGVIDSIISNNCCRDNFLWPTTLSGASEISINNAATLTTARIHVSGNSIHRDSGEGDIGILVGASTVDIGIGANRISGYAAEYQINAAAGVVRWTSVGNGTLPSHQAGFRGRIFVDDSGVAWVDTGSAWVKIGLQT